MADVSPFGWIWLFWHDILHWLYPGVGMQDTLPVTVAMIAFVILFYIAFRYFLFERLLKNVESKDVIINKFSIVISVALSVLGVYLGWIPFVAAMFGVFFGIIAILFLFILGFAISGMFKTAHAEYAAISADAAKMRANALKTRAEGTGLLNYMYKTARNDIEEIKDTRQLYNDINEVNTTARQDLAKRLSILQAFRKLRELLPAIERDTQRGDARLLAGYANALQAPHTTLSDANDVFRYLRTRFENNFNRVRLDADALKNKSAQLKNLQSIDEKDFVKLKNDLIMHHKILDDLEKRMKDDNKKHKTVTDQLNSINAAIQNLKNAQKRIKELDKRKTAAMEEINKLVSDYEENFKSVLDYEKKIYSKLQQGIANMNTKLSKLMHSLPDVSQAAANRTRARELRKHISKLFSLVRLETDKERKLLELAPKFTAAIQKEIGQLTADYNADVQTYNDTKELVEQISSQLANIQNATNQIQTETK